MKYWKKPKIEVIGKREIVRIAQESQKVGSNRVLNSFLGFKEALIKSH